jgi:hypothetical protein
MYLFGWQILSEPTNLTISLLRRSSSEMSSAVFDDAPVVSDVVLLERTLLIAAAIS